MSHATAIFQRQVKDTLKNKTILIQFVLFPALTLVMNSAVKIEGMPERFFVNLFATMYIGMAPLVSMAAVIAEEKENNTLRVLLLSHVKPSAYLLGVGSYIWAACLFGSAVICAGGYDTLREGLVFMAVMAVGILASLLAGAAIGIVSRTQMMATSLTVPVMMLISFAPMLSMFNETVAKAARFLYSEQIRAMLAGISYGPLEAEAVCIVAANVVCLAAAFIAAYKRRGLE